VIVRPHALGLLALLACAAPSAAAAQSSKADAFAGKVPPVSGQLYQKAGRMEVTGSANLSLNDAFFTKYFLGAKVGYHFTESLSADLEASGGAAVQTASAVVCSAATGCSDASTVMMRQVPGRIRWMVGAQAAWSPIYGKLDVLSEQVAHFDLSLLAGPDLIAHDQVLSKTEAEAGVAPRTMTSFGGHFGVGMRLFFSERYAVRMEFKDYVYSVEVPNGGIGKDVQNQLFLEIGVSMFFPGRNRP
jgi:outer membrane beta-barrel protein